MPLGKAFDSTYIGRTTPGNTDDGRSKNSKLRNKIRKKKSFDYIILSGKKINKHTSPICTYIFSNFLHVPLYFMESRWNHCRCTVILLTTRKEKNTNYNSYVKNTTIWDIKMWGKKYILEPIKYSTWVTLMYSVCSKTYTKLELFYIKVYFSQTEDTPWNKTSTEFQNWKFLIGRE